MFYCLTEFKLQLYEPKSQFSYQHSHIINTYFLQVPDNKCKANIRFSPAKDELIINCLKDFTFDKNTNYEP